MRIGKDGNGEIGTIHKIYKPETKKVRRTGREFKVQEFLLEVLDGRNSPNYFTFTLNGSQIDLLKGFKKGDLVLVKGSIRGRLVKNPNSKKPWNFVTWVPTSIEEVDLGRALPENDDNWESESTDISSATTSARSGSIDDLASMSFD